MCDQEKSFGELRYIGFQEVDDKAFALYNCNECNSTLAVDGDEIAKVIKTQDQAKSPVL
jgi:hypothetical protein